jgi:hypothetical protein
MFIVLKNMFKLNQLLAVLFLSVFSTVSAQTVISGTVFDRDTKEPLPFVNVVFRHSTVGTITDFEGKYFIKTNHPTDSLIAT